MFARRTSLEPQAWERGVGGVRVREHTLCTREGDARLGVFVRVAQMSVAVLSCMDRGDTYEYQYVL